MPANDPPRFQISTTQTVAGALAAVTSAVVGSRLGIAGTLVGAGAGSVVASAGGALYGHWLDRTATRVRTVVKLPVQGRLGDAGTTAGTTTVLETVDDAPSEFTDYRYLSSVEDRSRGRRSPWKMLALTAVAMFAGAIGSITMFEAIAGRPVASLTGAEAGSGTTIGRAIGEEDPIVDPPAATDPTDPASTSPTPTVDPTPDPTDPTTPPTSTTPPTTEPTTPPTSETPTTPPTEPPTGP